MSDRFLLGLSQSQSIIDRHGTIVNRRRYDKLGAEQEIPLAVKT
ncbi:hypothetical protein P0D88_52090 [Paraburkholderia sp. RL18-103-BIB-C]